LIIIKTNNKNQLTPPTVLLFTGQELIRKHYWLLSLAVTTQQSPKKSTELHMYKKTTTQRGELPIRQRKKTQKRK